MREPEQDEPLDIGGNLGLCRACGLRRVLCAVWPPACSATTATATACGGSGTSQGSCAVGGGRRQHLLEMWRLPNVWQSLYGYG